MAEFHVAYELDGIGPGLAGFMDQVAAGDAEINIAANKLAGDFGGREEAHRDLGQALDGAKIGAGAAGAGDGQATLGKPVAGELFKAALGGDGEGDGHFGHSASMRSTQRAQPEAAIGAVAPRRSRRRSY